MFLQHTREGIVNWEAKISRAQVHDTAKTKLTVITFIFCLHIVAENGNINK
jgi:hypothetical protein